MREKSGRNIQVQVRGELRMYGDGAIRRRNKSKQIFRGRKKTKN